MQIHIHHPQLSPNDDAVEQAVQQILGRFEDRLTRVEVYIKDVNADKGGVDKHCTIEARPRGLDPMAADDKATSIKAAVSGAAEKLRTQLTRHFEKLDRR